MPLNADVDFATAPQRDRGPFIGSWAEKRLLTAGHQLYKFTEHPLVKPDGSVTPWWSSVEPLAEGDPGLEGTLARAERLGVTPEEFSRARSAVTRQWNEMNGLLVVQLLVPAFAFAGRCAHQRFDEDGALANVEFIGGAWQLWIPNLTQREVVQV